MNMVKNKSDNVLSRVRKVKFAASFVVLEGNMDCEGTNAGESWCTIDTMKVMPVALKHKCTVMVLDTVNLHLQLAFVLFIFFCKYYATADRCMIREWLLLDVVHHSGTGLF
ncbi:hypothetical protein SADUNF_Sadunf18G0055300 [Salix dunnii]|uniref:Uncharacterized protein n=1 Tax=Salix dunnii TaxID=1413687 RepID=A0A835J2U3_9ROSI|nr:hypothetical protein SADUNF_Sadunf18G0055300 [Salix dunnii]